MANSTSKKIEIKCKGADVMDFRRLSPFQGDLKSLSEKNYLKLRKMIIDHGFTSPIHVWKDSQKTGNRTRVKFFTLDGHQRCRVLGRMKEEGFAIPDVPIDYIEAENYDQAKRILLSHASQYGKVEKEGLYEYLSKNEIPLKELEENFYLPEVDYNKFKAEYYDHDLSGRKGKTDDDQAPPVPENPTSKVGDIYKLGNHLIMCGDSLDFSVLEKLMGKEKADLIFTDPPYNANYSSRVDKTRRKPWGGIKNDNMTTEKYEAFLIDLHSVMWEFLKENGSIYECIDWKRYPQMAKIFGESFAHKSSIIWNKNYFGLGTYYRTKYEMILFGCKGKKIDTWNAGHNEKDVWDEDREKIGNYVHPTQKPVSIPLRAIKNSCEKGGIVLDLFSGSGSTLIACEKANRKCRTIELDPKYCDVTIKRWEDYTGRKAKKIK